MTAPAALAPIEKLGFLEVRTEDVDAMVAHYTDVLSFEVTDRDGSEVYLTTGPEHHCLVITQGERHGRASIGLALSGTLDDAGEALRAGGIDVQRQTDPRPGVREALMIAEVGSQTPIVLYETMDQVDVPPVLGPRPTKLGHVAAFTPDVAEVRAFYEDVLGFRWSDQIGDIFVFLRCNADHHVANFIEVPGRAGLHHVAYEARDIVHLRDILDHFARHGVVLEWGPGRHGPGHNIFSYHKDPDGNTIEVFTELDVIFDERDPQWKPQPRHEEFPMRPKVWPVGQSTANHWGPTSPEVREHADHDATPATRASSRTSVSA